MRTQVSRSAGQSAHQEDKGRGPHSVHCAGRSTAASAERSYCRTGSCAASRQSFTGAPARGRTSQKGDDCRATADSGDHKRVSQRVQDRVDKAHGKESVARGTQSDAWRQQLHAACLHGSSAVRALIKTGRGAPRRTSKWGAQEHHWRKLRVPYRPGLQRKRVRRWQEPPQALQQAPRAGGGPAGRASGPAGRPLGRSAARSPAPPGATVPRGWTARALAAPCRCPLCRQAAGGQQALLDERGRPRKAGGRPLPRGRAASAATRAHTLAMPCWQCMHCRRRARTHMRCSSSRSCWTGATDRCRTRRPFFYRLRSHDKQVAMGIQHASSHATGVPHVSVADSGSQSACLSANLHAMALSSKFRARAFRRGRSPWRLILKPEPQAARRRRTASELTRGVAP